MSSFSLFLYVVSTFWLYRGQCWGIWAWHHSVHFSFFPGFISYLKNMLSLKLLLAQGFLNQEEYGVVGVRVHKVWNMGKVLQTLFLFLSEQEENATFHLFDSHMPPEDGQMMSDDCYHSTSSWWRRAVNRSWVHHLLQELLADPRGLAEGSRHQDSR